MSKIDKFKFNPSQGFTDSNAYPNPVDEESIREQLQRPHNQTRDYINRLTTLLEEKGASFIATSDGKTVEQALKEIAESLGVSDYKDLSNKPSINGVELNGDASLDDLGLTDAIERSTTEALTEAKESGMFNGSDGYTPVKGEDYFTEEDKDEIANEAIAKLPLASYENYGLVKVDSRTAASDNYVTVTHARDAGRNEAYFVPTIKRFNNKPSTLNANFLPVATPSSNGAMSKEDKAKLDAFKEASEYLTSVKWEDIENPPFYKIENGDTLTWDGNTSGLEVVGNMYKVSNATPTASDFDKGCTLYGFLYGNTTVERDITELIKKEQPKGYHQYNADILAMGLYVIVAYNDCTWLGNSYTKGTWFMYMPDSTLVTRLTIDEYTGFGVNKQLDSDFVDAYTKGETNKLIEDAKTELNTTITNERTDLHLEIVVAKNELNTKIDNTKNELTTSIENTKTELNTKIDSLDLGVDSWNELEDKPFGSTYSNTLTWDGKTDGLERVEIGVDYYFYHVSNDVFTSDDISNGISYLIRDDNAGTTTSSNRNFTVYDGILMVEGYFIACVENDNTTYSHMTFPKKGTYFASGQGQTTISLTVNGYDGFEIIDAIDEKYLPKHTHDYLPITGGTIVSGSTTPLVIESTQDDFNFIGFNDHESNEVGRIGFYNGKPSVNVDNTVAEILHTSNYEGYITGFAELNHTHLNATDSRNGFMSAGDKSKLDSVNDTFAQKEHTHNNYSLTSHTHSEYANKEHTHSQYLTEHQDLSDYALKSELPTDYAKKEHTHSEYSPTNHTHDGLMSKEDKLKLNSVEEYAEKNIVIEVSDNLVVSDGIWLMTYYDAESNTNKQIFAPVVTENKIARGLLPLASTTEDGAMSSTDKVKLNGIEDGANKYVHPSTHDASMITQSATYRFVTDTEKSTWNNKASKSVATTSANGLMSASDKAKLDSVNNTFAPKEHTHPYVSSMNVNGVTLTYNKGDGTTGSVNLPSGGVTSWNDLEDKPFGEVASDTLTWDGNIEGKASVYVSAYNATLYHVSNSAPTVSDLANGGTYALNVFTPTDFDTSDFIPASPFIIFDGGAIFIALEDASYNNQQVIKGTYLVNSGGAYVKSFKVNGYTGFTGIKTIDEKYLPEGIGTGGDIDLSDYQTKTDSTLATSDKTVVGAINEVKTSVENKVDKVSGKGLSTNDLTANLKSNYDSAYSHTLNKSNPHGVSLSQLGVNATATELNYVDGVTSSIQTQLDNKAPSTHTHPYVSSMSVSGSTLKYTKGDGTSGSVTLPSGGSGGTGGGVTSWNDLEDKPFGEVNVSTGEIICDFSDGNDEIIIPNLELEVGVEYTVTWNGVEYKCVGMDVMPNLPEDAKQLFTKYVGLISADETDTSLPFSICTITCSSVHPSPEMAGRTLTFVECIDTTITQATLSIIYPQLKYLDNKYIKDMYGGGVGHKLDMLTAEPYTKMEGVIGIFYLGDIQPSDLEGLTLTITSHAMGASSTSNPLDSSKLAFEYDEDGFGSCEYVDETTEMFITLLHTLKEVTDPELGITFKKGIYVMDYFGAMVEIQFGIKLDENYLYSPRPILEGGIKYVPNKYLEILETTLDGGGDTLTWDGNTSGLVSVLNMYYHVSSAVPTVEDMANGVTLTFNEDGETNSFTLTGEEVASFAQDDGFIPIEAVLIIPRDGYILTEDDEQIVFPKKGIYFGNMSNVLRVTSFQINGYTFPSEEKYTIKKEYLPNMEKAIFYVSIETNDSKLVDPYMYKNFDAANGYTNKVTKDEFMKAFKTTGVLLAIDMSGFGSMGNIMYGYNYVPPIAVAEVISTETNSVVYLGVMAEEGKTYFTSEYTAS